MSPLKPVVLYYVHDPMCSWCWGFKPCWETLQSQLADRYGDHLRIDYVIGGLAPDTDEPMPSAQRETISATWRRIEQQLGTRFNHDFWTLNTPRRSTYMSGRAVIAAHRLAGGDVAKRLLVAIQEAYYLRALNPSDTSVLVQLAEEQGLDTSAFENELHSRALQIFFREQLRLTRSLPIQGFPSLVLCTSSDGIEPLMNTGHGAETHPLALLKAGHLNAHYIMLDYQNPETMFDEISHHMGQFGYS